MGFDLSKIEGKPKAESSDRLSFLNREIKLPFSSGFSNKKKEIFYTELGILLTAGLQLKEALQLVIQSYKSAKDRELIGNILSELVDGSSFHETLAGSGLFTKYEYVSVQMGEETGKLSLVIKELSLFFNRKNKQRRVIINALSYPIVVLATSCLVIAFMLRYVIPMFADIFEQNRVELPALTKIIISVSAWLGSYYWLIFIIAGLIVLNVKFLKQKQWFRSYSTSFLLKIPFWGDLLYRIKMAQFSQAVALLYASNIPLLESISITQNMIPFYPLEKALLSVKEDLLQGLSLNESLNKYKIFDKRMVALVKVAEETNASKLVFQKLTEQYTAEIEYKTQLISSVIEPAIILILGTIVAVILIAMYLPIFSLSSAIH